MDRIWDFFRDEGDIRDRKKFIPSILVNFLSHPVYRVDPV
jgi:hypothetical protein